MSEQQTLEKRVADLEKCVELLTREVFPQNSKPGWVQKIVGSMEDDAAFAEILKLGQQIRQSEQVD